MTRILTTGVLAVWLGSAMGCGSENAPESHARAGELPPQVDRARYLLADEPDGAVGVIAARNDAQDGDEIVLVGRIGGRNDPWIDGRAAFTMIDASMTVVEGGPQTEPDQLCMDDCCASLRSGCTTLVKVVDSQNRVLPMDARQLLQATEDDMIVVKGRVKRDEEGGFSVVAHGVYVRR